MAEDALARAREIAARLSGTIIGSELGKRKNRYGEDEASGPMNRKKIYIPTGGDINFLGLLIGPKGITQKQMQESTGAKILIRGKGASKEGGPANHPDDDDELHVMIEGSEEAVDRAAVEIEKIFNDPASAQRLKNEQLRQLAGDRSAMDSAMGGGGGGGSSDSYQIELRVPNGMVGLIIGKGGENILRIQSQLNVSAQVARESDMKPGDTLRSIVIKGNPTNVQEAKKRIDDIIETQLARSAPAAHSSQSMGRELDNAFVVKLPVPNDKVGIIIGKGGMTIKGIQERTRANVQIPQVADEDNPQVRTISIGADTKEAVDAAQMEIFMTLQAQQNSAQQAYNSSANSVLVMVPDERIGAVIGKGGSTVKDMQARFGVRVHIPQGPDIGSNPPVRTVCIVGPPEMQAQTKYEIEMIIAGNHPASSLSNSYNSYGASSAAWGAQAFPMASYYGAPAANPYAAAYSFPDMSAYYGAAAQTYGQGYPVGTANGAAVAGATAASTEVPTDPTAYYKDYWQYAAYYGEAAARVYYGAWSPPEGTPPPAGVQVAADPNTTASSNGEAASVKTASPAPAADTAAGSEGTAKAAEGGDAEAAAVAWEAYKKQYAEWYESFGKAQGADPNPPML